MPINIEQDPIQNYQNLGYVHQEGSDSLPLFGRQKYQGSDTWEYYVSTNLFPNNLVAEPTNPFPMTPIFI